MIDHAPFLLLLLARNEPSPLSSFIKRWGAGGGHNEPRNETHWWLGIEL